MYSNCLFEALKAKIKDPKNVQIIFLKGGLFGKRDHFMWMNNDTVFHAYNPKGSNNNILYNVSYKKVDFDVFEGYVIDAIKKLPLETQLKIAKNWHLKSIEIPGVVQWANFIKDDDPEFSNIPKTEDFYYLTKILRKKPLIKIFINSTIKTIEFDKLLNSEGPLQWKYVTPFDNDYTAIYGWLRNRNTFVEMQ